MRENVACLSEEYRFEFLCDGHSRGTRDTRKCFYDAIKRNTRCPELDAALEVDVIARCRLLRNIDPSLASKMAHAAAIALKNELDRVSPQVVLCFAVDDYMTHLLCALAKRRNITYIGYNNSYFPGLIQIAGDERGRAVRARYPDESEVESVISVLSAPNFRQDYNQALLHSRLDQLKHIIRGNIKNRVFRLKAFLERDPLSLHYSVTPFYVDRRRMSDYPKPNLFDRTWIESVARLKSQRPNAPVLYIPLGYFPESTIDYWIENKKALQYTQTMLEIVASLARECICVVKEHVHMIGARDPLFYRDLKAVPGVVLVNPTAYSNDVLLQCDALIVGAGSSGVEARIRGKPIYSFSSTSYWFASSNAIELDLDRISSWASLIRKTLPKYILPNARELRQFVADCLSTTVRRRPGGKVWPCMDEQDLRELLQAAAVQRLSVLPLQPDEVSDRVQ